MTTKLKGVMIKGMDMPQNCFQCPCSMLTRDFENLENIKSLSVECQIKERNCRGNIRPSWCPLQEVK